jgi:hypothetical protein
MHVTGLRRLSTGKVKDDDASTAITGYVQL